MVEPYASTAQLAQSGIVYERLFSEAECERIRSALLTARDWAPAHVVNASDTGEEAIELMPEVRLAEVSEFAGVRKVMNRFCRRIEQKLVPGLVAEFGKSDIEPQEFCAIRYTQGGRYLPHRDNGGSLDHRAFSVVCYLNEDFVGGGTCFPDMGFQIEPRTGMAIAFPSEYLHAALPVEAGCKQVLVSWIRGGPAIAWI
ncbi:2OG-Fe(II) oxygenase [Chitinimonas sp. BJYL2]|uniref:prolyl hydroxylase family protein n=1 Tax=Chitinimonas sp. BJYL2 TaxID=2976696 RepID=UPI0022B2F9D3|nr:2OG-Fe(II) oxygenase [Chitinimonas sp. BJYL2]